MPSSLKSQAFKLDFVCVKVQRSHFTYFSETYKTVGLAGFGENLHPKRGSIASALLAPEPQVQKTSDILN